MSIATNSARMVLTAALLLTPPRPLHAAEVRDASADQDLIAVRVTLKDPGFVTLVIDDAQGRRVRNLISETPLPAGENVVRWDGLDDRGRDTDAAKHAVYHVPGKLVAPGSYRVRGLVRPALKLLYELTPYNAGSPPWRTAAQSSQWLANHTAPSAVLFLLAGAAPARPLLVDCKDWNGAVLAAPAEDRPPYAGGQLLVGSHVSEGGSGLAWFNTDGRKLHGQMWLGGVWTAASQLARDTGKHAVPGVYAACRTDDSKLLMNSGEALQNLFKTGGCLDLMSGADPAADPRRQSAAAGDVRLLVTRVKGRTTAMLYRPVAPGRAVDPVEFTSPVRSLRFDRVENVSSDVNLKSAVSSGVCTLLLFGSFHISQSRTLSL